MRGGRPQTNLDYPQRWFDRLTMSGKLASQEGLAAPKPLILSLSKDRRGRARYYF